MIDNRDIESLRKSYTKKTLSRKTVMPDPHEQFILWLNEALNSDIDEPNAMVLATSSKDGVPGVRTVLLKGIALDGYIFYSNYLSRKAQEIEENPNVSALFMWKELERQLIISGRVEKISKEESLAYFQTRPEESRIGAWASIQSSVVPDRAFIEEQFTLYTNKYAGTDIPIPDYWGGYKIIPNRYEFWQGRENRLHDRIVYLKEADNWRIFRLSP